MRCRAEHGYAPADGQPGRAGIGEPRCMDPGVPAERLLGGEQPCGELRRGLIRLSGARHLGEDFHHSIAISPFTMSLRGRALPWYIAYALCGSHECANERRIYAEAPGEPGASAI